MAKSIKGILAGLGATKRCPKCGQLRALDEFYKRTKSRDGLDYTCKYCRKTANTESRRRNIEYYREYDRQRANLPHRQALRTETTRRRRQETGYGKIHAAVARAVKSGRLIKPDRCEKCDEIRRLYAHHDDYTKPLDVRWLCQECHAEEHPERQGGQAACPDKMQNSLITPCLSAYIGQILPRALPCPT